MNHNKKDIVTNVNVSDKIALEIWWRINYDILICNWATSRADNLDNT